MKQRIQTIKKCACGAPSEICLKGKKDNKNNKEYFERFCKQCYENRGNNIPEELKTMLILLEASSV